MDGLTHSQSHSLSSTTGLSSLPLIAYPSVHHRQSSSHSPLISSPAQDLTAFVLCFSSIFFFWNFRRSKIFSLSPWDVCFNFSVGVFYLNYGSQPKYISILVMLIVSPATRMNIHFRFYAFVKLPCIWMFIFIFMLLLMVFWVMNLYCLTWRSKGKTFFFFSCRFTWKFSNTKIGPKFGRA